MKHHLFLAIATALALVAPAQARELHVLLGLDSGEIAQGAMLGPGLAASLGKATNAKATLTQTSRMGELLRAEPDVLIAPPHAVAAALRKGYTLVATSGKPQTYALVTHAAIQSPAQLASKRLYLAQADSLHAHVAKGLLREHGVALDTLGKITYGDNPGSGLVAMSMGMADATLVDEATAREWVAQRAGKAHVLHTSKPLPGGLSIAVRKEVCATDCPRVLAWVQSGDANLAGVAHFSAAPPDAAAAFQAVPH